MSVPVKTEKEMKIISDENTYESASAFVYAHRTFHTAGTPIKIGSHTGSLKRLWSRYNTYHGHSQEFKVIEVKQKEVRCYERAIQLLLEREGLWREYELFDAKAWEAFERVARPYALPNQTILHVFKRRTANMTVSITIPDDDDVFDVEYLPVIPVELEQEMHSDIIEKKRKSHELLPYAELIDVAWSYLASKGFVRDLEHGYILKHVNAATIPFTFEKICTVEEFVDQLYAHPDEYNFRAMPQEIHAVNLRWMLRSHTSSRCPFVQLEANSVGFLDGLLKLDNGTFTPVTDLPNDLILPLCSIPLSYAHGQIKNMPLPDLQDTLSRFMSDEMCQRVLSSMGFQMMVNDAKEEKPISPSLQFLSSDWVCRDIANRDGTTVSEIQAHYAKWQGNPIIPMKVRYDDFQKVNPNWKIHRPPCCLTCCGAERRDIAKIKKVSPECVAKGHKNGTYDRRVRTLTLVPQVIQ